MTIENATAEGDVNPTFNVTADLSGITEHGKMTLDMGYLPTAADELTAKVQAKLLEGDWLTNPYASNPILTDLKKMVQNGVIPAFSEPLKEEDPDRKRQIRPSRTGSGMGTASLLRLPRSPA